MSWTDGGRERFLKKTVDGNVDKIRISGTRNGGSANEPNFDTKLIDWRKDGTDIWSTSYTEGGTRYSRVESDETIVLNVDVNSGQGESAVNKIEFLDTSNNVVFSANISNIIFSVTGTLSIPKITIRSSQASKTVTVE